MGKPVAITAGRCEPPEGSLARGESGMLKVTEQGLFCAPGGFHIDPWGAVDRAVITHAHSDHARAGSAAYLCAREGEGVLRVRLGARARIETLPYGEPVEMHGVKVSLHPAGHVLGSAQVRLESRGEVWVVAGDYKRQADPTCAAFEPVRCHGFVTESTFGLPVYRWPHPDRVFAEIHAWWQANQALGRTSVLFAYSLGKAQRLLAGVEASLGPILVHEAVEEFLPAYRAAGVALPEVGRATAEAVRGAEGRALVVAPPPTDGSAWLEGLGEVATGLVSGWMLVRGVRRRGGLDRGFVMSDHADWPGLIETIRETGASQIRVTHGAAGPLVRWLSEHGWQAEGLTTRFVGETADGPDASPETSGGGPAAEG